MGSNDHLLVPDPKERSDAIQEHHRTKPRPPEARVLHGGPTTSNERLDVLESSSAGRDATDAMAWRLSTCERLDSLEKSRERHDAQAVGLRNSIVEIVTGMASLTRLLKQTARGVERLAQGHSQGNLGLPTNEDWASYDTTL